MLSLSLLPAEPKMEGFLSDLAVRGNVAVELLENGFGRCRSRGKVESRIGQARLGKNDLAGAMHSNQAAASAWARLSPQRTACDFGASRRAT